MPLSYAAISTAYSDPSVISRLRCALIDAALNVISEPVETTDHDKRAAWAHRVIRDPGRAVEVHGLAVLISADKDGTATDNQLKSGVAAIIPAYLGA
jgi:hypothetical protein